MQFVETVHQKWGRWGWGWGGVSLF